MNAVDQENRRTAATLGERDPSVTPVEAAFFASNQVGELIDALSRKGIIGSRSAKDGTAGQKNFSPRSFSLVVLLHHSSHRSVKEKARLLESNRASGTAHGGSRHYC